MNSNEELLSLGKLIAKLRNEKGFSQRKFAQISGLSNTTISRIENGETQNPGIETIKHLAACLDYDEAKLIDLINPCNSRLKSHKKAVLKFLKQPVRRIKRYSSVSTSEQLQEQSFEPEQDIVADVGAADDIELAEKVSLKGMKLITLRLERNVTQKELADALGIDKTLISQYEGEIIKPDLYTVQKLADFFEVDAEYFIDSPKKVIIAAESPKCTREEEIITHTYEGQDLSNEYLDIALELQAAGIEIEDVRAFINMIKKYKR